MPIDFFNANLRQKTSGMLFGICDNQPACLEIHNTDNCGAKIINNNQRSILFIPIDHNIIITRANGETEKTCDALLRVESNSEIVFLELTIQRRNWIADKVEQLQTTILAFNSNHNINFAKRSAYICHKSYPNHKIEINIKNKFKKETNMYRLYIKYEIKIN
ncbi:MAG: hypothetical protein LBO06_07755 [Bacteroidales bacterium]|jgi:hypothetical protein|nr:hypothetical protein [Bacteroidales bacterium]